MAAIAYILAGIFGYLSFADGSTVDELDDYFGKNIFAAPYHKTDSTETPVVIYICLFGMMFCVTIAAPFCVLPTKDSIEEVRNKKFTKKDNVCWTVILTVICCAISCAFENITLPIQLLGATTNSAIGFLLPICYYLKMEKRTSPWTNMKIFCYFIFGFICISSVIELVTIFMKIAKGTD